MEGQKIGQNRFAHLRVLVLGVGSIGERHIRNLWALGVTQITAYRTRNLPFRDIGLAKVTVITDLNAIQPGTIDCAIICSPTHLHLEQSTWCAAFGIHTLIEKPISHSLEAWSHLKQTVLEKRLVFSVAYMMRFHPLAIALKEIIASGSLGKVVYVESEWREFLPDWHPWEDYRESYAALAEMGGGAALTLSHDLDLVCWLLNRNPISWQSQRANSPTLQTTADTISDFLLTFPDGIFGRVHLNMAAPIPQRKTQVIFEKGIATFDYFGNTLITEKKGKPKSEIMVPDFERNQMYVAELMAFLTNVNSADASNSIVQIEQASFITQLAISQ
jgi:predicted dehydrogenase